MRILIATGLYPPEIGGPATYSKLLFDKLPKQGIEVEVLPFREVKYWPYIIRHIVYFFKILKRSWSVNVVYAQDPLGTGMPAAFAAKILRKKFIIKIVGDRAWETGVQKFGTKDSLDIFSKKLFYFSPVFIVKIGQWLTALLADKIIVPSKYLKNIVSNWGVNRDKIYVIYNAFDAPESSVGNPIPHRNGFNIISAGRLVSWKGFETLIEIMPDLVKQITNLKLFIIGDGPERKKLTFKVSKTEVYNSIVFTDQLKHGEVLEYLKSGDLFVLNTGYEGLSHQILEAMAVGIPVITTNVGGNPELITDGANGILVEYNNKEQIKNAILRLYKGKDLRVKFIKNAKQKAGEFSKEKMIKETIKILS